MPEMAPFLSALAGQKRRFAIRQLYELGSSFYIKTHSFIHSLNKDVLSVLAARCWGHQGNPASWTTWLGGLHGS